jgi:hypothetical protein
VQKMILTGCSLNLGFSFSSLVTYTASASTLTQISSPVACLAVTEDGQAGTGSAPNISNTRFTNCRFGVIFRYFFST